MPASAEPSRPMPAHPHRMLRALAIGAAVVVGAGLAVFCTLAFIATVLEILY